MSQRMRVNNKAIKILAILISTMISFGANSKGDSDPQFSDFQVRVSKGPFAKK